MSEITGTIKIIGETKTYGDKGFRKRELILTSEEQFPQTLLIEVIQDLADSLDEYAEGERVTVRIILKGREWINPQGEAKYFNSVQAVDIGRTE